MGLKMPKIKFLTDNIEVNANTGTPLIYVCQDNGFSLPFGCTQGNCGTCLIRIKKGEFSDKTEKEKVTWQLLGVEDKKLRLGCQCKVIEDVEFESGY